MSKQFENPQTAKVEDETILKATPRKTTEVLAEKSAEKSTKAVQSFDKDNSQLFSR
jgi:hypothetical protein